MLTTIGNRSFISQNSPVKKRNKRLKNNIFDTSR